MDAMFPTPTADANVIRYRILFQSEAANSSAPSTSDADGDDATFVEQRRAAYVAYLQTLVGEFIWHKHAMHLVVAPTSTIFNLSTDAAPVRAYCLCGETSVGDAIDDEWVVTWLLFQLTIHFRDDDALVQVNDTDGEFLLIECADVLPDWVSPENSVNRVFVRHGVLHLVSVAIAAEFDANENRHNNNKKQKMISQHTHELRVLEQAMRAVWDEAIDTRANAAMQRVLQLKISEAQHYVRTNRHRVRCLLPVQVAHVLSSHPVIMAAAVEAFYYRDPREATALCRHMKRFPPAKSVTRLVTMSRCQYAQLRQQQFFAPLPFHHLPGVDGMATQDGGAETRAVEIGVKLACGLELLYASGDCDQFGTDWASTIDRVSEGFVAEDVEEKQEEKLCVSSDLQEDDDAWLYVHPDSLEEKLQRVASRTTAGGAVETFGEVEEDDTGGGAEELQNIATMFNKFLSGVSGVDGVEESEPVQLDMSSFMDILKGLPSRSDPGVGDNRRTFDVVEEEDNEWDDPPDHVDDGASSEDSDDDDEPEDDEDRIMREAMDEMDAELRGTTLNKTFTHATAVSASVQLEEEERDAPDDADRPLDLDFHLLSNLLESMASQNGLAGPVSNILSELTNGPRGK